MSSGLFGWDLLYGSVVKDIKNNQDILVCLTHLVLISNEFKCIGLGESKNIDGSESKSESLPEGWNSEHAIRYVYQGRLYNLKATCLEDGVIINLLRVDERTVGMIQLNGRQVASKAGTLDEMIPNNKQIVSRMKEELIDKVVISNKSRNTACQTDPPGPSNSRSFGVDPLIFPSRGPVPSRGIGGTGRSSLDPFGYGRSDLDPFPNLQRIIEDNNPGFGRGGGMLFQPPRAGSFPGGPGNLGIPPGSLPPGARFDPFRPPTGPPAPRGPRRPDNDEFPPPGYDDMYM